MRRLDRRIATIAEAHPLPYAVAVGLAAGVLTLLVGWLARREWIWFLFIVPTIGPARPPTPEPAETGRTASVPTDQLIAVGGGPSL